MGNFNSQSQKAQVTQQLITYQQYLQMRPMNSKLSQMSVVSQAANEDIQIIRKVVDITKDNQKRINQYLRTLEQMRKVIDCDNLYLPAMYKIKDNDNLCRTYPKLEMFFDYYEVKLKEEIKSRRNQRDFFSEEEVWYILYSLFKACRKFEKFNMASGPLKTSMILLNQKGHLKLLNILSAPEEMYDGGAGMPNFYAPQELRNIRERGRKKVNPNVAQTFSIGMILLEVCSLIDSQSLYDFKNKSINEAMMTQVISFVQKKYSKLLVSLIKTMTSMSQSDRPLPSQVYDTFKPYQRNILNLKPFKFSVADNSKPSKKSYPTDDYA